MKKARTPRTHTRNHTKRHGKHHKHSHNYLKAYAPYLPLVVSIVASIFLSFWHPQSGNTLAYATSMSASGLLASTNSHRSANGKSSLSLNAKLNNSAQAKANDLVAKNYWAHTSPNGTEPWVFISNAGYSYTKAGENLAYGFATTSDTVAGWMASASHKANMLDGTFTQVGFGFKNATNYCWPGDHDDNQATPDTVKCFGKQTIVVAHYAKPQVLAAQAAPVAPAPAAPSTPIASSPAAVAPTSNKPTQKAESKPAEKPAEPQPVNTEQPVATAAPVSQDIAKVQTATGGDAPWLLGAATLMTGLAVAAMLLHHSLKARHLLHDLVRGTERFVLHHPLLDSTLLGLAIFGMTLLQTAGTIL